MQHRKMSARYIPDAILAEILKRLPVKSLLRCRCVQKSWYHLIRTSYFVNLHLNHNQNITTHNPKYLLFRLLDSLSLCLRYDDDQCEEFKQLRVLPDLEHCEWLAISSSLICLSSLPDWTCNIYLWNPIINRYKTLPVLNLYPLVNMRDIYWVNLSFGYVPSINDYRVVKIINYFASDRTARTFLICVYSLNTNSWKTKTIEDNFLVDILQEPKFVSVNGVSFWRVLDKEDVTRLLSYDTKNDVLRSISLPDPPGWDDLDSLHQYGQSIAYFVGTRALNSNVINMWILKEDSTGDFLWEKQTSVNLDKDIGAKVLGIRNNGELIVSRRWDLISYNPEHKKVNDFAKSWNCCPCNAKHMVPEPDFQWSGWCMNPDHLQGSHLIAQPFVDSLVLLDMDSYCNSNHQRHVFHTTITNSNFLSIGANN